MNIAIEFLRDLADKLQTQDNAYTASPNYCIQENRLVCGIDEDYGGKIGWFSEEAIYPEDENSRKHRALERYYDRYCREPNGWTRCGYKFEWRYTGMSFLTKDAADAYVAGQKHRHTYEIRVYVDSHYRNREMREVRRLLSGPLAECVESLKAIIDACKACEQDDYKSIVDEFTEDMERRAIAALASLETATEPHQ